MLFREEFLLEGYFFFNFAVPREIIQGQNCQFRFTLKTVHSDSVATKTEQRKYKCGHVAKFVVEMENNS